MLPNQTMEPHARNFNSRRHLPESKKRARRPSLLTYTVRFRGSWARTRRIRTPSPFTLLGGRANTNEALMMMMSKKNHKNNAKEEQAGRGGRHVLATSPQHRGNPKRIETSINNSILLLSDILMPTLKLKGKKVYALYCNSMEIFLFSTSNFCFISPSRYFLILFFCILVLPWQFFLKRWVCVTSFIGALTEFFWHLPEARRGKTGDVSNFFVVGMVRLFFRIRCFSFECSFSMSGPRTTR